MPISFNMETKEYSLRIGDETITAQFDDLANQTNGSVLLSCGDTVVLATAVMSANKREGQDWFPLSVEFEEKFYSVGKILGSRFMRKEGMPSTNAVLNGRMIDRTIRPLFDNSIRNDIQVIVTILSLGKCSPDILAINAASLALGTSDIPWNGPVSAVRITANDSDELAINFNLRNGAVSKLDLIACGKDNNLNMLEIKAGQSSNELIARAFQKASEEIEKIQVWQKEIIADRGKEKIIIEKEKLSPEAVTLFTEKIEPQMENGIFGDNGKIIIEKLKNDWLEMFKNSFETENPSLALAHYEKTTDDLIHKKALEENTRVDGRKMDEIRALVAKAGKLSPSAHGTGIFYRGGTHVFSALTLGGPKDTLLLNGIENDDGETKRYFHHYNFPPFSTGETGRVGGFNRRMIGHGMLAEKALLPVLPSEEKFPYTIRIVSESMASNGSTSMASSCASTIALMDAGVPIKAPVAGIAMGLMMKDENNYKILTDIQGPEDHYGDMDFKVAGTRAGVTAIQMDVKVNGVPIKILSEALVQAEKARLQILDVIEAEIARPRADLASNAPRIIQMRIKPDQIGEVIGPGGKMIKEIKKQTGAEIDIEDDGRVFLTGLTDAVAAAQKTVTEITKEYKVGEKFEGVIIKLFDFGAIVKIGANAEGMVHISEIAPFRIEDINRVLEEGMKVPVIIKELGDRGKIKLSIKAADPKFIKQSYGEETKANPSK